MPHPETDPHLKALDARRQALKQELARLEYEVETSLTDMKDDLAGRVSPVWWIRRYPLQAVGAALALGFLAAAAGGRRYGSFAGAVVSELKATAARKAVQALVEAIDKKG